MIVAALLNAPRSAEHEELVGLTRSRKVRPVILAPLVNGMSRLGLAEHARRALGRLHPWRARLSIAMDGPSGSGKSSTRAGVAARLGLRYLDTGAQFRALTHALIERGVDFSDPAAIATAAARSSSAPATTR